MYEERAYILIHIINTDTGYILQTIDHRSQAADIALYTIEAQEYRTDHSLLLTTTP